MEVEGILPNGMGNGVSSDNIEIGMVKKCSGVTDLTSTQNNLAGRAMQFLQEGNFNAALQVLNALLGDEAPEVGDLDTQVENLLKWKEGSKQSDKDTSEDFRPDDASLIEKRCLVNMRLKRFTKVVHDAKKMLDFSSENPVAYKCLLAALCKMKKLEQANEIIRLWQKNSPRDLEMMECRTKLESLMVAVKNGIEASDAFSDVEDLLGLNYDWLLLRKSKDSLWKFRPLPTSSRCSFVLCLQYRFGHCSLGEKCPDAHGEKELEEWKKRFEIENVTRRLNSLKVDDGSVYIKDLLAKFQAGSSKEFILCDKDTDQIQVSCSSPLHTTVQQTKFKKFTWKFSAKCTKPISHVALLHEHHRQYFHISSCSLVGANETKILTQSGKSDITSQVITPQLNDEARAIIGESSIYKYKIKVVFTPEVYGNFRQSVVFDSGDEIKVIRNVSVDVVPPVDTEGDKKSAEKSSSPVEVGRNFKSNIPWNFGNAEMLDGNTGGKVQSEKLGFALISTSPTTIKSENFLENTKDPLSKEHYKERMRFLLTQEERARQEILAKYNVTTNVHLSETYVVTGGYNEGMNRYAQDGALFGRINLFRDISEDTAVGRLILRSCNSVLLTKTEESRKRASNNSKLRVYLCPISDKSKNSVYLELGRTCVEQLELRDGNTSQFDIQFQLDRTSFIEQKEVIDQLQEKHLNMLFPDLAIKCNIPWSPIKQWSDIESCKFRLNPKQKEALIAITAEDCPTPPILVIGPFGSGKTFTLAQCIRKILSQKNSRVMVCTHSNSAADLYIKEYLDSWVNEGVEEARPLRIYYEMRNLSSVHPVVLKYCKIEAMKFRAPTMEEVMEHRVIVVTLSTSYLLMKMNLPEDTFSHILLDEAAQAMESEAITPLMSASDKTKLVLAGDHFQLSPELFSEEARNIHPSLLERLHALYEDVHPCKLMLCENYRSHSAIIQFVSDSFYTKKLECAKSQPVHLNFYPLTFFAARGEDVQDSESTSYYNMAEVFELTEKITELISSWPEKWGDYRDENAIGVLTPYADQVNRIRSRLRKKGLHSVSVERVFNVQGKQFRAVFLSTVRTFRPWVRILPESVSNEVDLGFFSSPKLLNTALTRAQSLVAVVGDPVSLCSVGKCRRIWEDYIRICNDNQSLFGMTFLQLKQNILGVEMRLTWGLNPLANEFQPQKPVVSVPALPATSVSSVNSSNSSNRTSNNKGQARHQLPIIQTAPHFSQYRPIYNPAAPVQVMHPQQMYGPGPSVQFPTAIPYVAGAFHPSGVPVQVPPWPGMQQMPPPVINPPPNPQWYNSQVSGVVPRVVLPPSQYPRLPPQSIGIPPQYIQHPYVAPPVPGTISQPTSHTTSYQHPPINVPNDAYPAIQNSYGNAAVSAQSQYATGQPLYRRPTMNHAGNYETSINQAPPYHTPSHVASNNIPNNQPKLTPDEINFITRALEQQASSGEPFYGDIQNIRSKLIQAATAGDMGRSIPPPVCLTNHPELKCSEQLQVQQGYSSTNSGFGRNLAQGPGSFAPVPEKSPAAAPSLPDNSLYTTNSYQELPHTTGLYNRVWSNTNSSSFPPLNEGTVIPANSGVMNLQQQQQQQGFVNTNDSSRRLYASPAVGYNTVPNVSNNPSVSSGSVGQFKSLSMAGNAAPSQQSMIPSSMPLSAFNNNSVPSYYDTGYQADVGGLKAQLSGGLRQGFGERSAFSRVNGNQDLDLVTDNSGLGRSYANVVKAAVTTAAVGAFVSTSTVSMAASAGIPQATVGLPSATSGAGAPTPYHHMNLYGAIGGNLPGQFGPY